MKISTSALLFTLLLSLTTTANALIAGDVTGGGSYADSVASDNGWIVESAAGNGVDFWTLNATAGDTIAIDITSSIDFGISIYSGAVSDDLGFAFNNDGDFIDPISFEPASYIGGTNGLFGEFGSQLSALLLPATGIYTIAIGGDLGFGGFGGPFNYQMDIDITPVSAPAGILLLLAGLASVMVARKR